MTSEWVLLGGVIGAFAAFIFNLILWYISRQAEKKDATRQILIGALESTLEEAIQYWAGHLTTNRPKKLFSEARLKLLVKTQPTLIENFISDFSKDLPVSSRVTLENFKNEAFELITGGAFESPNCKDLKRCKRVASTYTKALLIIQRCS